jgi:c-di-GMP-binding flagellar brake protein YcgR
VKAETEERRKMIRFPIRLPVRLKGPGDSATLEMETRDVSAGGAFLPTDNPLPVGIKVALELVLLNHVASGPRTLLRTKARVVRSEPSGMAVEFFGRTPLYAA